MTTTLQSRKRGRLEATGRQKRAVEQGLAQAFVTFTQAAGSLERSYTLLQNEVSRLHEELGRTNAELDRSLEENARMRAYLAQVLENLPCGAVVAGGEGTGEAAKIQVINPEARRLLQIPPGWQATEGAGAPELLEKLLAQNSGKDARKEVAAEAEQFGRRFVGISQSNLNSRNGEGGDRIWILRDITEEKRLAARKKRRPNRPFVWLQQPGPACLCFC
jgi:nitrogen fixation/metabolism regulation signal transduction histidine kinase